MVLSKREKGYQGITPENINLSCFSYFCLSMNDEWEVGKNRCNSETTHQTREHIYI